MVFLYNIITIKIKKLKSACYFQSVVLYFLHVWWKAVQQYPSRSYLSFISCAIGQWSSTIRVFIYYILKVLTEVKVSQTMSLRKVSKELMRTCKHSTILYILSAKNCQERVYNQISDMGWTPAVSLCRIAQNNFYSRIGRKLSTKLGRASILPILLTFFFSSLSSQLSIDTYFLFHFLGNWCNLLTSYMRRIEDEKCQKIP